MSVTNDLLNTVLRHAGQEVSRKEFLNLAGRGLAASVAAGTLAACQDKPSAGAVATTPTTGTPAAQVDASTTYTAASGQQVPSLSLIHI